MKTKQERDKQAESLGIQARKLVNKYLDTYLEFVVTCLHNEYFTMAMDALLPFDNFACDSLIIMDNRSGVSRMGVAVMRVDINPDLFALGVSMEIKESECNTHYDNTTLMTKLMTLERLRDYVQTEEFVENVKIIFERMIYNCFHTDKNRR